MAIPTSRPRRALITGVAGQDGGYLAEQLVADGYRVWGIVRPGAAARARALPWLADVELLEGDLGDRSSLERAVVASEPDELYNLASHSAPGRSWTEPEMSAEVNAIGPLRLLEIVREVPTIRFVHASSSEMWGLGTPNPQDELTPLSPPSPYGAAKAYAHQMVGHYRSRYRLFASTAILYNHESPRRGEEFVTRKITLSAARIKLGRQRELTLGSLESCRDWGYAPDYMRAMRLIARTPEPDDFVIGTGRTHSVGDFLNAAFARVGLDPSAHVRLDPALSARSNPQGLAANPRRARERLGWNPSVSFEELVGLMVDADLEREAALVLPGT